MLISTHPKHRPVPKTNSPTTCEPLMSSIRIPLVMASIALVNLGCSNPVQHAQEIADEICECETSACVDVVTWNANGKFSKADIDDLSESKQEAIKAHGLRAIECRNAIRRTGGNSRDLTEKGDEVGNSSTSISTATETQTSDVQQPSNEKSSLDSEENVEPPDSSLNENETPENLNSNASMP